MPFPLGRLGTTDFFRVTGISKTVFFTRYRNDPAWQVRLDMRFDAAGRLHMDEEAVRDLAQKLVERDGGRTSSRRAHHLLQTCETCEHRSRRGTRVCRGCGRDLPR